MYGDVKGASIAQGAGAGAGASAPVGVGGVAAGAGTLPVTGALLLGWRVVAAVVLLSVGAALLSTSRVLLSRARRRHLA